MSAPITAQIVWDGVRVEITHHERRWNSEFDHIELKVVDKQVIPVTETGYRSHFIPAGIVEQYGGASAFVCTWLDHEAQSPEWEKRKEAAKQLSLF